MTVKFSKYIKEWRRYWYLPLVMIVGALLMSADFGKTADDIKTSVNLQDQEYVEELENRVENMLTDVTGAGICKVTITLSSGSKKEYVREEGAVLVITDKSGNEIPVVASERLPEIAGVTIVSNGARNISVRSSIIESVSTLLNVGTNKICVVLKEGN